MSTPRSPERLDVIDVLRGIAALSVVCFHYVGYISSSHLPVSALGGLVVSVASFGHLGVPVFFVISGYVMMLTASRSVFTIPGGLRFLLRRMIRIAIPYWIVVLLICAMLAMAHAKGRLLSIPLGAGQVVAHLLYAQDLVGAYALDAAFWTLCLEVQFYVVFTVLACACSGPRAPRFVAFVVLLTVVSFMLDQRETVSQTWFLRLWWQFGLGILCFAVRERNLAPTVTVAVLFVGALLGLMRADHDLVAALATSAALVHSRRRSMAPTMLTRAALGVGQVSYSLYLTHGKAGTLLGLWLGPSTTRPEWSAWLAITASLGLALFAAQVFFRLCESPAMRLSRRVLASEQPAAAG